MHERLPQAFLRKKSTIYFVNSMSDLFYPNVPFDFIEKVFDIMMAETPQHIYQILTKNHQRMSSFFF
ncbi:DUF5131 family protein [Candidatus Ruthia endofausta]|uniref:DUF5131 family protein n=1 Tax=Candidatus Ruthia endofausta TaxID=2738852 RepID=A0A6N0HNM6_9GAMM|nr:DUF5131 family protein [Candidatus Ruthia endofausta]QKQ23913.1 DUF5131 family protein [Candidatus Ruthia endofausta]